MSFVSYHNTLCCDTCIISEIRGGTVAEWLVVLPHSKKVVGSIPGPYV